MTQRVRTGLRIPYEQNTKLILLAEKMGVSKNAIILQAIREFLEKNTLNSNQNQGGKKHEQNTRGN